MNTVTTIGIDLAKNVFSICGVNAAGRVMRRQDLQRDAFALWLAQVPAGTVIAMEACTGAHHRGRRSLEHGLVPRLMATQFIAPFRKNLMAKNDHDNPEAIATAARQGNMRFIPVDVDQQARLAWHRVREGYKAEGLAINNRLRGILAGFGIVMARSDTALRRALADLEAYPTLPTECKELLRSANTHWEQAHKARDACETRITSLGHLLPNGDATKKGPPRTTGLFHAALA